MVIEKYMIQVIKFILSIINNIKRGFIMKTFKEYVANTKSNEVDTLDEAVTALKVYDYYLSTMTKIRNFGTYYSQDQRKVDKINRRILTDYANDPKKLKEIYKQLSNIINILEVEMKDLESIIG